MLLVLDNHDSFTWNLVHYLATLGVETKVARSDALDVAEAMAIGRTGVLISPGPGAPADAGISLALVAACVEARRPLLGVCLGHQAIGAHFGGRVERAPVPMHGKVSAISHDGSGLFAGLPDPVEMTRYHSLAVAPDGLDPALLVNATAPDGTVQGLRHRALPVHGVQFHPESIASAHGMALLANFTALCAAA